MSKLPIFLLILVSAIWGIHAVVGKAVESQLGPFPLTVLRFTFGALFYTPMIAKIINMPRKVLGQLILAGLFWAVLYPLFFYESLRFITPVESSLFINTSPLISALLGGLLQRERLDRTQWLGIGIAFLGVVINSLSQWQMKGSIIGIIFIIAAAASFSGYTVISHKLAKNLTLLDMVGATSIFGMLELWILTIGSGHVQSTFQALAHLNLQGWGELFYVVVIVSVVSYLFYGFGLKRLPSAVSAALSFYPQIVFVALTQWIWLGITPTWITLICAGLILGGVLIMQTSAKRPS